MARPAARVLTLLELLQSGGVRTVTELAGRLGVDGRTVRRYVNHLIDLDVPVESVRGRYGGYRLASGYRMPPLMLSDEEARSRILRAAVDEPPRVRAMVGALAELAGARSDELRRLHRTLNSTTKFVFGPLVTLPNAKAWGAR